MKSSKVIRCGLILAILGSAAACSVAPLRGAVSSISQEKPVLSACLEWFSRLDRANESTRVTDAQAVRVPGYPYLRTSRLLSAYRHRIVLMGQQRAWLARLRALDQQAREVELANMGPENASDYLGLKEPLRVDRIAERTRLCGERLIGYDLVSPSRMQQIRERAVTPDAYSGLKRAAGLYPLTRPLLAGVQRRAADSLRARLLEPPDTFKATTSFWPGTVRRGQSLASTLVTSRRPDELGLPVLTAQVANWLLQEYAPVVVVEQGEEFDAADRPGQLQLRGKVPDQRAIINTDTPTVYGHTMFTRYGGRGLIQLVYSVWLPSGGTFDGLVFRVTLDRHGRPAIFDSMHASGMDHHFVPTSNVTVRKQALARELSPISLPAAPDGHRVRIRINKPGNMFATIDYVAQSRGNTQYELVDTRVLRSLPVGDDLQVRRSVFQPDGFIAGTDRPVRFRLWPSGIKRVGAQRQWGGHAISLTDRRHFDDAELIGTLFKLP